MRINLQYSKCAPPTHACSVQWLKVLAKRYARGVYKVIVVAPRDSDFD